MAQSIVAGVYDNEVDRDSAYEMLQRKVTDNTQQQVAFEAAAQQAKQLEELAKQQQVLDKQQTKEQERLQKEEAKAAAARAKLTQDVIGTLPRVQPEHLAVQQDKNWYVAY